MKITWTQTRLLLASTWRRSARVNRNTVTTNAVGSCMVQMVVQPSSSQRRRISTTRSRRPVAAGPAATDFWRRTDCTDDGNARRPVEMAMQPSTSQPRQTAWRSLDLSDGRLGGGGRGGTKGNAPQTALCRGRHFEGQTQKYGILQRVNLSVLPNRI